MQHEKSENHRILFPILSLLIALIFTGVVSVWAAVDTTGRNKTALNKGSQILLSNLQVFNVVSGTFREAQDILIEGTQIKALGSIDTYDKDATKIDLSGKFVFPGLFECHTHLAFLSNKKEKEMIADLRSFVTHGITQVRDVGGPIDILYKMHERISSGEILGPKIFYSGSMLEKPPLFYVKKNKILPGLQLGISSKQDVDRILLEFARKGACMVKTYNKMDLDVYQHLLSEAKKLGLRVVHDPGRYLFHGIPMDLAIDLGVTSIEHGVSPWPVVLKDALKKEHDRLMADDIDETEREDFMSKVLELGVESISMDKLQTLIDKVLENDVYFCPTLWIYGNEDIFTQEFIKRKVKNLVGHDGCSPTLLFTEMKKLRERGLSELEIIRGTTIYPAQWLGVEDRYGSISPGVVANLVILDENPLEDIGHFESPYMVIMNGRVVFKRSN